jgi:cell fate regulator YaaT (PSP1 superfamily)
MIGELVKLKRHYLGYFGEELPKFQRKASSEDLDRIRKNLQDETRAIPIFKKAMEKFNLNMKLVSIHYQFDRKKLFFFYTADGRVDFRELAKELASEFKTRIELRQIGVRDEAKKVGGVGTCGREYCCISFLSSFKRITTQLANEQNLLSSMGKLSGPCGKLKCCLSFEVE